MSWFTLQRAGCLVLCCLAWNARAGFVFTTLVSFDGTNGANPVSALAQGADGNFYGTTAFGGVSNAGTVFQLTTNGVLTNLFSFRITNGINPQAGLVTGTNGAFYGATYGGGANKLGTLFTITTNGTFTLLTSFAGMDGANPDAVLTPDTNGNFYGTTALGGGKIGGGTVFRVTSSGMVSNLVNFDTNNGAVPQAELVRGADGDYYGTTYVGGTSNLGTVFKVATNGALTTLYAFTNGDGANPDAGLLLAADGNFYGTTYYGGDFSKGTVFRLATNGALTVLFSFHGTNGANPQGRLVQGDDGNLYGTTVNGGTNSGLGTVFQMTTNGGLTTLHSFDGYDDGAQPEAGLIPASDGNFYGTACFGGTNNAYGTVFRIGLAPAPVIESITGMNGDFTLIWSAVAGQTYQLQFRTNLAETIWHHLATNTATGPFMTNSDTTGPHKQRFYRVLLR